ncbi:MAG TPA: carbohydrate porin [Candidatus Acidoferrales bacterium]|nr:carbohydrate porin [Candidatus Acidoferrales bacterium]
MRIAYFSILTLGFLLGFLLRANGEATTNGPPATLWTQPTLFGNLGGLRSRAETNGITFLPVYNGEIMGELAGHHPGDRFVDAQYVTLPLTVDLEKFAGWREALFHVNAFWLAGRGLTEDSIHDLANVSNINAYRTIRLNELWLQQSFLDQNYSVRAGMMDVDTEFFTTDTDELFISSSFGTFSLIAANLPNPPIYPEAVPAVRFAAQAGPHWRFLTGIYDGDALAQDVNKNGIAFHLVQGDGALIFSEISFQPHPEADDHTLADIFKLGGFYHTLRQPTWNAQIGGASSGGGADFGIYGLVEQELYKSGTRKITVALRGGTAPAYRNVISWYMDVGLNFTGFLPGRENDVAGVGFARSTFSRSFSDFQQATSGTSPYDAEMIFEATYKAQLTPWWTLQPDLQVVFTPGGQKSSGDAIVLGLRTAVSF